MSNPGRACDQTSALVSHASTWSQGNAQTVDAPAPPQDPSTDRGLTTTERATALRAARYAAHAHRGPVGDVIKAKIEEYVMDGKQLAPYDLARRLVRSMQTMEARDPLPPLGGYSHLPAIPEAGHGMRWRYRTAVDASDD